MQKVKTFFHIFINSLLPQAPYYHKLIKTSISFSIKYFTALIYIVNFIFSLLLIFRLNASGILPMKDAFLKTLDQYPKELSITVQNGTLQSNYGRPYFIWLDLNKKKRLLGVVDESASSSKIHQYDSSVLFTAKHIVFKTDNGLKEIPYGDNKVSIDKADATQLRVRAAGLFSSGLIILLLFFILVAPLIFTLMYLLYFFVLSLLAYFFFKIFSRKIKLSKAFQISLHAVTIPILVDYGLCLFRPEIARLPLIYLVFFILSFVFVASGIFEAYLDPVTRTHHKPH